MSKTALLILSEGSEEMEAVISADVLRRAGVKVTIAGLQGSNPIKCSRDVVIVPDVSLQDVAKQTYDAVILPGGLQGAESFAQSDIVKDILQSQEKSGRLIAAICAAPIALKSHSIGTGKQITSHPCKQADLSTGEYTYVEKRVVVDEHLITSRGPGTAFEFALAIVKYFFGKEKATSLINPMLVNAEIE
ncbi:Protein/nucleic acid deglycase DJ-1 [Araneus ventricosus]|uniref:Protein/nucleic acid deglycase DJ-1 n=1 Tax=Araneus ventricosus TaxID=182803 RepID=A0A4Y2C711_ARAVE|nr:Protein/nucleic acid deglycase DJ-1 [Araneus ventricosus]